MGVCDGVIRRFTFGSCCGAFRREVLLLNFGTMFDQSILLSTCSCSAHGKGVELYCKSYFLPIHARWLRAAWRTRLYSLPPHPSHPRMTTCTAKNRKCHLHSLQTRCCYSVFSDHPSIPSRHCYTATCLLCANGQLYIYCDAFCTLYFAQLQLVGLCMILALYDTFPEP